MSVKTRVRRIHNKLANRIGRVGRRSDARWLYWSVYYPFNFGDWIGPFLFKKISAREPWFGNPSNTSRGTVFMCAGSILEMARGNSIVWGSGIRTRNANLQAPWEICAVRGPYTKERYNELSIACPEVYGDPGILLPRYYRPVSRQKKYRLGVIPHFREFDLVQNLYSAEEGVKVIDVRYPIEHIIESITSCERIVSSSLHGLIVSNAYGIQAGWVKYGKNIGGDGIKFLDYYASLGCYSPACLDQAIQYSTEDLIDFAGESPLMDTEEVGDKLLKSCPFP